MDTCHNQFNMHSNTLRPIQNGRHFSDDIFEYTFLDEHFFFHTFSLEYVTTALGKHCFIHVSDSVDQNKVATICGRHFKMHFLSKLLQFDLNFIEVCL